MARLTVQEGKMQDAGERRRNLGREETPPKLHGTVRAPNGGTDFVRETEQISGDTESFTLTKLPS